ncbi:MAG: response regulator [Chloroflexi bacterium]|nr:MAG: response regulator [Chloroflexota bacterium]TMF34954.1 MAG: response regulator [Chloroflexota bacterium]
MIDARSVLLLWFPDQAGITGGRTREPAIFPLRLKGRKGLEVHILMIEDDASIADMYRLQLEHDGYKVTVATTGEIAFSTLSGSAPDLVLLDLLLPDRSGFEVLDALNERFPNHPPVVILSNYGEPSMIDRGRSLGAIEYLVKSRVTPADISEQIPMWVEQGRRGGRKES